MTKANEYYKDIEKLCKAFGIKDVKQLREDIKGYTAESDNVINQLIENHLYVTPRGPRLILYLDYQNEHLLLGKNNNETVVQPLRNFVHNYLFIFTNRWNYFRELGTNVTSQERLIRTIAHMRHLYGDPEAIRRGIIEVRSKLFNAYNKTRDVNVGEDFLNELKPDDIYQDLETFLRGTNIAGQNKVENSALWDFTRLLKSYDLRLGQGIKSEHATFHLMLKWSNKFDSEYYYKIRNSFTQNDWKRMIKFETSFNRKYGNYDIIDVQNKDSKFSNIFQFDKIKEVIEGYSDEFADRLALSSAWIAKNILKYTRGKYLGLTCLQFFGNDLCWIESDQGKFHYNKGEPKMAHSEEFRKLFNIPKRSYYNQRNKIIRFFNNGYPGQQQGFIEMDPPDFLSVL